MYYVNLNSATYGPYTEQQMRQMVAAGQMSGNTLVFEQGGKQQWLPASQYPSLFINPSGTGFPPPNPGATSIPITPGNVETTVWQGRPSAWTLLDRFIRPASLGVTVLVLTAVVWPHLPHDVTVVAAEVGAGIVLILLLWLAWQWILLKTVSWTLTTERLCWERGVFSRTTQNLELYRIKDISLRKPFLMRLLRRGYLDIVTSDQTEKCDRQILGAIARPDDLHAILRKYVERQRQQKGVREVDFWHA
jgi:membrane protein YdbS with pleckstrin-like domain